MKHLLFITYYTKNTIYEKAFKEILEPSLKKFHLHYIYFPIESSGNWYNNAYLKPQIILNAMETNLNHNIVWCDSDSEFKNYPSKFNEISDNYDIGLIWLKWIEHYGRRGDENIKEMLDGTIWLNNSKKMRSFVRKWKESTTDKQLNHQKPLSQMLVNNKDINVYQLSRDYSYILTTPQNKPPAKCLSNPIIVHYQLSRQAKKSLYINP